MLQAAKTGAGQVLRVGGGGAGVVLAGVADPDRKQSHYVGGALGCPALVSVAELLECGVDAVTIAAPTHLHRDIALACIARGVHVLVEKPIASTVAEGEEIIVVARGR